MKRRDFVMTIVALGATKRVAFAQIVSEPQPVPLIRPDLPATHLANGFSINKPGRYFFDSNQTDRLVWTIEGSKTSNNASLGIHCGSVEVDLRGYTLFGTYGASISMGVRGNLEQSRLTPGAYPTPASFDGRFVSIRNGSLISKGKGAAPAIEFINQWQRPWRRTGDQFDVQFVQPGPRRISSNSTPLQPNAFPELVGDSGEYSKEIFRVPKTEIDYVRNEYLFENLAIKSNLLGMAVEGSHTTIRNCSIESAGVAALFIAGPNVTIENCTILLKPQSEESAQLERPMIGPGFARLPDEILHPPRAAIVLRDGANAVIRNNRIHLDHGTETQHPPHCILVQDGAKNVLVEGNTFINLKGALVSLSEGAQVIERNNVHKKRLFGN